MNSYDITMKLIHSLGFTSNCSNPSTALQFWWAWAVVASISQEATTAEKRVLMVYTYITGVVKSERGDRYLQGRI